MSRKNGRNESEFSGVQAQEFRIETGPKPPSLPTQWIHQLDQQLNQVFAIGAQLDDRFRSALRGPVSPTDEHVSSPSFQEIEDFVASSSRQAAVLQQERYQAHSEDLELIAGESSTMKKIWQIIEGDPSKHHVLPAEESQQVAQVLADMAEFLLQRYHHSYAVATSDMSSTPITAEALKRYELFVQTSAIEVASYFYTIEYITMFLTQTSFVQSELESIHQLLKKIALLLQKKAENQTIKGKQIELFALAPSAELKKKAEHTWTKILK